MLKPIKTFFMDKIYLPAHIDGLPGTGWSIVDGELGCGYEDYGKAYHLPQNFSMPPAGYVGYWDFEPDATKSGFGM